MEQSSDTLQLGDLVLDMPRQRVLRGGQRVDLPGLSFRLLEVLVREAPAVVSRRELGRRVWGDVVVSGQTVRQRVRLLRRALGDGDYVATVKGVGYRLAEPVLDISTKSYRRVGWFVATTIALALCTLAVLGFIAMPDLKHVFLHAINH